MKAKVFWKCFTNKSKNRQPGSAFLEYLEAEILKISPHVVNHVGVFVGSVCVLACPKNSKFAFKNNGFIFLFEQNKLVSSVNMVGFKNCDTKHKSFIYKKYKKE